MDSLQDQSDKNTRASSPDEVYARLSLEVEQNPDFPSYLLERYADQEITASLADLAGMIKVSKFQTDTLRYLSSYPSEMNRVDDYDQATFLYGAMIGVFVFESLKGRDCIPDLSESLDTIIAESQTTAAKYPTSMHDEGFLNSILGTAVTDSEQYAFYLTLLQEPRIGSTIDLQQLSEAQDGMAIVLAAYHRMQMV